MSEIGISALEGWSHYSSTKAAVLMFTQCLQKEESKNGMRCVGLSPGTVATEFQRQIKAAAINPVSKLDWSVHIPPEWAAEAVAWLTTEGLACTMAEIFQSRQMPDGPPLVYLNYETSRWVLSDFVFKTANVVDWFGSREANS